MVFVGVINPWRADRKFPQALLNFLKAYGSWLGIFAIVYFVSWPGMWVAPGKMLFEVYGNAFSYAFQGARLSVTHGLQPSRFELASVNSSFVRIFDSLIWRTTPVTWLGLLFSCVLLFHKNRELFPVLAKYVITFLILEAFACIGMFALVQGRDQPHYILAAYYGFEFAAAMGWVYALRWLAGVSKWADRPFVQSVMVAALVIAQAYPLFYTSPYFYTYLNPILLVSGERPVFHYGERMEAAAAYLASKPDAEHQTALVYFGRSFSYYYPGKTLLFKPVLFDDKSQLIENLRQSDYLVIYTGLEERLPLLSMLTPEQTIDLNGKPYVQIYRVSDIPSSFYNE